MIRVIFSLLLITHLKSQSGDSEVKLLSIDVRGNSITSKQTIASTSGLVEGDNIRVTDFPRAVKRLWQLGLFQDVQILYDQETKDGISLTIDVKENFILGDIKYDGNKKIKNTKIEAEIALSSGQRIKPNTISNCEEVIKKLYAEKGYLNAKIKHSVVSPKTQAISNSGPGKEIVRDIIFNIEENKKTKVKNIVFNGNKSFSLQWYNKA